jgi:hypothetical protein
MRRSIHTTNHNETTNKRPCATASNGRGQKKEFSQEGLCGRHAHTVTHVGWGDRVRSRVLTDSGNLDHIGAVLCRALFGSLPSARHAQICSEEPRRSVERVDGLDGRGAHGQQKREHMLHGRVPPNTKRTVRGGRCSTRRVEAPGQPRSGQRGGRRRRRTSRVLPADPEAESWRLAGRA